MKALVTGGAGFIGAHLVRRLAARGASVAVIDNLHRADPLAVAGLRSCEGVTLREGDIRDRAALDAAVAGCDVVYHLAAQSNVMGAMSDIGYSVSTNVDGTVQALAAARAAGVSRFVFTSSREAYGEAQYVPVDEAHPRTPKNLYGASKIAGEAYCRAFAGDGFDVNILRLANVYGPGDSGRVIPLFVGQALRGEDLVVYGGEQILDFVWIETVSDALEAAGSRRLEAEVNIGTGVGTSIADLARRVLRETGSASRLDVRAPRDVEVTRFIADTARMRGLGIVPDADPLVHLAGMIAAAREPARRGG